MRRRGNSTSLCRQSDRRLDGREEVNYFGGKADGVEVINSMHGKTTYRVGPPLSGNSAFSREPTTNEIRRDLERDLQHVQKRIKEIKS